MTGVMTPGRLQLEELLISVDYGTAVSVPTIMSSDTYLARFRLLFELLLFLLHI